MGCYGVMMTTTLFKLCYVMMMVVMAYTTLICYDVMMVGTADMLWWLWCYGDYYSFCVMML